MTGKGDPMSSRVLPQFDLLTPQSIPEAVAMLAQLRPIAVIFSALFLAGIYVGADAMSRAVNIPNYIADVLVAVSLLSILVSTMLMRYKILWGK